MFVTCFNIFIVADECVAMATVVMVMVMMVYIVEYYICMKERLCYSRRTQTICNAQHKSQPYA